MFLLHFYEVQGDIPGLFIFHLRPASVRASSLALMVGTTLPSNTSFYLPNQYVPTTLGACLPVVYTGLKSTLK